MGSWLAPKEVEPPVEASWLALEVEVSWLAPEKVAVS